MNMAPERHKIYLECANAVKQEPVEADTLGSAKREIEYVCVKEETTEWEVPDGHDEVPDPLSIDKKELSFSEDFLEPSTFNIEKTEEEEEEEKVRGDDLEVSANMAAHWSHETRIRVIRLIEDGHYCPSKVGERCGIPKVTVRRWWREYVTTGRTSRLSGSGRPRVSTKRDDQRLLDNIHANLFLSLWHLGEISQFPGSARTLRRRLKDKGLSCQRAAIKQHLTVYQRIDRMAFAEEYIAFDWNRVIFSDEKIFSSSSDAPVQVHQLRGDRFSPNYLMERERSGHHSVAVWGYISAQGAGPLWQIEGILNTEAYINILQNIMKPSVEMLYPQGEVYFLQGHSLIHRSRSIQEWFNSQDRIKLMAFIPRSPDLNPIENMWTEVTRLLPVGSRNASDLWENIEQMWWEINHHETLSRQLVESVPRRLREILRSEGGWVRY